MADPYEEGSTCLMLPAAFPNVLNHRKPSVAVNATTDSGIACGMFAPT
jgi:hypothetical protein